MTYREYFDKHETENMNCCRPFQDKTGDYTVIIYGGEMELASTPSGRYFRYNGTLTDAIKEDIAKAVNNGYYCYHGWTDERIALDVMHEVGCSGCPFRDDCEMMNEEMET